MYQSRCPEPVPLCLALSLCLASSCGLVDLRPVGLSIVPAQAGAVLATTRTALTASFDAVPDRLAVERSFQVSDPRQAVVGDFLWSERAFSWSPVVPWSPGVRYRLAIHGSIPMTDGREARLAVDVPFYAVRRAGLPTLVSVWPESGASIDVPPSGQPFLRLDFSGPMDTLSVEKALVLQPACEAAKAWNDDHTGLSLCAKVGLLPRVGYRWSLGTGATDADGAPLAEAASGTFRTDDAGVPPVVERVYAASRTADAWVEAAETITSLDTGQSIAIRFSKDMDAASVRAGIRLEPGQSGTIDCTGPRVAIFTPSRGWQPGLALTLVVSTGLLDQTGLHLVQEYRENFMPVTPYLALLGVETASGERASDFSGSEVLVTSAGPQPDGILSLALTFSAPFDAATMVSASQRMHLTTLFPSTIPSPSMRSIYWPSSDTVVIAWEGLRPSDDTMIVYYRLSVDGGPAGIATDSGLLMRDDASLILEMRR